jgi:hypothetical protein
MTWVVATFVAFVIVGAVVLRAVAVGLWRASVIGDRALVILSISRFPAVTFAFGLILRVPLPLLVVVTLISLLPGLLLSRVIRETIGEQSARR